MKDYKTLTREKVDVEPGAARYMGETHMMEDWSDNRPDPQLVLQCLRQTPKGKTGSSRPAGRSSPAPSPRELTPPTPDTGRTGPPARRPEHSGRQNTGNST